MDSWLLEAEGRWRIVVEDQLAPHAIIFKPIGHLESVVGLDYPNTYLRMEEEIEESQIGLEDLPLGYYLLVFVLNKQGQLPELSLPYNIRNDCTIGQLKDIYFQAVQQRKGKGCCRDIQVQSVVVSKRRMAWSKEIFHKGDYCMSVRQWIQSNLNGESTIYVYIQEGKEEAFYVGPRDSHISASVPLSDLKKTRGQLQVALYMPDQQPRVTFAKVQATTVGEYLEGAGINSDMSRYDISVKLGNKSIPISLQLPLHHIPQGARDNLISMHSCIELRPKQRSQMIRDPRKSLDNNQPFLLNFHSKDRYFQSFSVDYHTHHQFRCVNLSRMAGFQSPNSIVIHTKLKEEDLYLKNSQILTDWQRIIDALIRLGKKQLDCYFLNEHQYYYKKLQSKEGQLKSMTDLRQILKSTANADKAITQTNKYVPRLQGMMGNKDQEHQYLPSVVKSTNYFPLITAYTSNQIYQSVNKQLRSSCPAVMEQADAFAIGQIIAQRISYLPLCDPNQPYYRGIKMMEIHERGEIIFYRQIVSSSRNRQTAIGFIGANNKQGTLSIIDSFSSRLIDPFSVVYANGNGEKEYIYPPYIPFLVIESQRLPQYYQLKLQQLPLIRNYQHQHLIWLGENMTFIVNFYNQLRYWPNRGQFNEKYLKIELLPFKSDQRLQLWLKEFKEIDVEKEKAICVFELPAEEQPRLARVRLIEKNIKAKAYICYSNGNRINYDRRCEELQISKDFINKLQYCSSERDLKYSIIRSNGFDLESCAWCHSYCQTM